MRYPPACCGVGDYAAQLAGALAARGWQPVVFTGMAATGISDGGASSDAGEAAPGVRVVRVALRGWRDLGALLGRIEQAGAEAVQIEYSSYGWSRWGWAFWVNALVIALGWRGVPVTLGLHEFPLRLAQHPRQAVVIAAQWLHVLLLAASAAQVMTNTEPRVRTLRRWLAWRSNRIRYRPNSSTIAVAAMSGEQRDALRLQHGAGPQTLVVASFGMFGAGKNYEALIEAAGIARRKISLRLWLLGNWQAARPAYIEHLREVARRHGIEADTRWPGNLPATEISAHLQSADLFVLPQPDGHLTRSSAFMAAAAHGLATVAVRNAACQKEFVHGRQLWLAERSEASTLAAAMIAMAAQPEARRALGANLRGLYEEIFDWPATLKLFSAPMGGGRESATRLATPVAAAGERGKDR